MPFSCLVTPKDSFNTQPRGGGCGFTLSNMDKVKAVSTHSRAEAAALSVAAKDTRNAKVSTHSRAEAAAYLFCRSWRIERSFNTQPRGGGC